MSFLLRIALPDVPGSLGAVATALGETGADIQAIEVVERRRGDTVVDDVLLELPDGVMPDALVTACHRLDDVNVEWISRYTPGASLSLDLEAIETFSAEPDRAIERMTELLPTTFRSDWAMTVSAASAKGPELKAATVAAPELPDAASQWLDLGGPAVLVPIPQWPALVLAAAPATDQNGDNFVVVIGRHGGPDFLASEVARLGHMVQLAAALTAEPRSQAPSPTRSV